MTAMQRRRVALRLASEAIYRVADVQGDKVMRRELARLARLLSWCRRPARPRKGRTTIPSRYRGRGGHG